MGLKAIPMRADTGPIGGDLSHEFHILAEIGESEVYCDRAWLDTDIPMESVDYDSDLEPFFRQWTSLYAATDEVHKPEACPVPSEELVTARGIEVGQLFYFGTKYSRPLGAVAAGPDGDPVALEMGSYGIGVSRLVGALIEANHDDAGIIWPESVAPFRVGLINLRPADARCRASAEDLYAKLRGSGIEVLYDDRNESPGAKFATMDLIGLPDQLVIGPRGIAAGVVETKNRRSGERLDVSLEAALDRLIAPHPAPLPAPVPNPPPQAGEGRVGAMRERVPSAARRVRAARAKKA
jgi:prolyl-tRNA synthetase